MLEWWLDKIKRKTKKQKDSKKTYLKANDMIMIYKDDGQIMKADEQTRALKNLEEYAQTKKMSKKASTYL